ncbi:unnamed protein product [Gadus morhua 'NCC']
MAADKTSTLSLQANVGQTGYAVVSSWSPGPDSASRPGIWKLGSEAPGKYKYPKEPLGTTASGSGGLVGPSATSTSASLAGDEKMFGGMAQETASKLAEGGLAKC